MRRLDQHGKATVDMAIHQATPRGGLRLPAGTPRDVGALIPPGRRGEVESHPVRMRRER